MNLSSIRLALRHLMRQKLNTTVHIIGLTLGISVCLLIGLFLHHEITFDNYHHNAKQIYRINSIWSDGDRKTYTFSTPIPLADALRNEVSGLGPVTLAHPVWESRSVVEINPEKKFRQDRILIVEPSYPEIFRIEALTGDPAAVLRKPYHALLTESTSIKFFGHEDPVGKVFRLNNEVDITVGGVIKDIPANSHQPASMLLSYVPDRKLIGTDINTWTSVSGTATYVVVPDHYKLQDLQAHLDRIVDKYTNSTGNGRSSFRSDFDIQPLGTIHFESKYSGGSEWVKAVNTNWLWFFALIGISVLCLACINFVNLSTAQAMTRAREVGVLKTVGAGKLHLVLMFLREAWLLTAAAGLLSVCVVQLALPYMNTVLNKQIRFELFESPVLIAVIAGGVILTGLLAGLYPAFVIARFNPAVTLKSGSGAVGSYGVPWLKHALIVTQFTLAAGLLISMVLIAQQVDFLRSRSLGFDRDNIIKVDLANTWKLETFKAELQRIPQISDVAFGTSTPSDGGHWGTVMSTSQSDEKNRRSITVIMVDERYCEMYGLKLLAGRFPAARDSSSVSSKLPKEEQVIKVVVNEKVVRDLGYKSSQDALQQHFWIGMNSGNAEIIGVVADFNTLSLREAIPPVLITINYNYTSQAGIKIARNSDLPKTIAAVEAAWKRTFPEGVFKFDFLDEQIDDFYKAETNLYAMFRIFTGMAMLISCLGLWGISAYAAQQRTKEVGIRKILGASLNSIVMLLSRDLLVLVLVAIALAIPLSYFMIHQWLEQFAFRAPIGWSVFVIGALVSMIIALATVSAQAIRAGMANPTESLKSE